MESLHGSQLRKRPKLWALIEASTERQSRDLMNHIESSEEDRVEKIPNEIIDVNNLPKDKILIVKYDEKENETDKKKISLVKMNAEEKDDSLCELDFIFAKLNTTKNKLTREKSFIFMDENFSGSDSENKVSDIALDSIISNNGSVEKLTDSPKESNIQFIDKFEIDSQISKYIDSINE